MVYTTVQQFIRGRTYSRENVEGAKASILISCVLLNPNFFRKCLVKWSALAIAKTIPYIHDNYI